MLAAGLLGLDGPAELPRPSAGPCEDDPNHEKLCGSLEGALDALAADHALQELLGEDLIRVFTTVKRAELARFRSHVTDWERNEYLEVY